MHHVCAASARELFKTIKTDRACLVCFAMCNVSDKNARTCSMSCALHVFSAELSHDAVLPVLLLIFRLMCHFAARWLRGHCADTARTCAGPARELRGGCADVRGQPCFGWVCQRLMCLIPWPGAWCSSGQICSGFEPAATCSVCFGSTLSCLVAAGGHCEQICDASCVFAVSIATLCDI